MRAFEPDRPSHRATGLRGADWRVMPFEEIALVDNHAHLLLRPEAVSARPFASFFTEAPFPSADTLFYRSAVRDLAALVGCEPDESSLVAARAEPAYARRLFTAAHVEPL